MAELGRKRIALAPYKNRQAIALAAYKDRKDIALAEYKEVVDQFRKLTDIRFKLLTYLPLGTGAAAFFGAKDNELGKHPEISAFAFVVTLCIATYDKRNDQHYDELVSRAAELERELQIEHGSFSDRPRSWLKYGFVQKHRSAHVLYQPMSWLKHASVKVEHRWPIGWIYMAAASLWVYLFAASLDNVPHWLIWLKWLKFAPAVAIPCWLGLRSIENTRHDKLKQATNGLMDQLIRSNARDSQVEEPERTELVKKIMAEPLLDVDAKKADRRVKYYWKEYQKKRGDPRAASALLGAVIDLPARWIEDVWTGRR